VVLSPVNLNIKLMDLEVDLSIRLTLLKRSRGGGIWGGGAIQGSYISERVIHEYISQPYRLILLT
jgi:hypothetical protein